MYEIESSGALQAKGPGPFVYHAFAGVRKGNVV
jgi:hypothetical protein